MSKTLRNVFIALAVSFFVSFLLSFGVNFLTATLGASEPVDLGIGPMMLSWMAGGFTFLILSGLSGNRKVSRADEESRRRAIAFETPASRAALYLVRTGFVGKAAGMNISLDGQDIAQLKSPRFTRVEITPGQHTLRASFGGLLAYDSKAADLTVDAKTGEILVVSLKVAMGAFDGKVKMERVSPDSVRDHVSKMKMAAPMVAAV